MLYQMDVTREGWKNILERFWSAGEQKEASDDLRVFSAELFEGVAGNMREIDDKISRYAANWQLERMAFVDRNIMRLGCFELVFRQDIPPKVAINEAVELAKKYSGSESGKFVNAILDQIKNEQDK